MGLVDERRQECGSLMTERNDTTWFKTWQSAHDYNSMPESVARRLGPLFHEILSLNPETRRLASKALLELKSDAELREYIKVFLFDALDNCSTYVWLAVAELLSHFDRKSALRFLIDAARDNDNDFNIALKQTELVGLILDCWPLDVNDAADMAEVVSGLAAILHSPHEGVRWAAIEALASINEREIKGYTKSKDVYNYVRRQTGHKYGGSVQEDGRRFRGKGKASAAIPSELKAIGDRIQAFREETIPKLQDGLNLYLGQIASLQSANSGKGTQRASDALSSENKSDIVNMINSQLDRLGLAIDYKNHACYFSCTGGTSKGRFLLVPKGSKTALLARVNLSDFLPLKLIDGQPNREPPGAWWDREQERRAQQPSTHLDR